jgi:predicted small secreted protein
MKRIIAITFALAMLAIGISSCGSAHKTGCPNNQGIIH